VTWTGGPAVKEGKGIHPDSAPTSQSRNAEEQGKRERWEEELARVLDELCGDEEGLEEMIAAFLSERPGIRHRSALRLADGKTAEAAREFHKLKGTLSYLAGTEKRELTRRAEAEARQGVLSPRGETVRELDRFLDAFDRFLRERGKKSAG